MSSTGKHLSNPFSTGGGGLNFETRVQASFAVLMLAGGFAPALPKAPIAKIKLQGKHAGFATDDLIVFTDNSKGDGGARLLGQIKHSISITEGDSTFEEVIHCAWTDFQNAEVFSEGRDSIALITGPLSATDIENVRFVLEWARSSEDADDFLRKVGETRFSSNAKRAKLQAFRAQLKKANEGADVSEDQLWRFLKSYHLLGYDLDIRSGVTLSLLHSLIGQRASTSADSLWALLLDEVQHANQNAGTISQSSVSEELRRAFQQPVIQTIPADLEVTKSSPDTMEWEEAGLGATLAVANLLGAWDETRDADRSIAARISDTSYSEWVREVREALQLEVSPLSLRNGTWSVSSRLEFWRALAPRLFDQQLDTFSECALNALTENDPKFDLKPGERYAASVHGKVLEHSPDLRNGLAQSIALLGSARVELPNCSTGKAEAIADQLVRTLLGETDWLRWGSLDPVLPLLAEAAPDQFLAAIEGAMQEEVCPFDELFSQEGHGVSGSNYMIGVIWALETLAWDERYLVRACLALGGLAARDPGGQWSNRPSNSLTTIFLPWLPQTVASVEKRRVAIETLSRENPDITWPLLMSLLPGSSQSSSGTRKPEWRVSIPEDWQTEVPRDEYWEQVSSYSDMAVEMAQGSPARLRELIGHFHGLPEPAFERLLTHISSAETMGLPQDQRRELWEKLTSFTTRHRRYSEANWTLRFELLSRIEEVAQALEPTDPSELHRRLFSGRDLDLYEERGDWGVQAERLEERRRNALGEILDGHGIEAVREFAESVDSANQVGTSLGWIASKDLDSSILPELIESESEKLRSFASGYVWGRHHSQGLEWSAAIVDETWTPRQIGQLVAWLPFGPEVWGQATSLLGDADAEYWNRVRVNPWQTNEDLEPAIEKLLEYGRPAAAIECLYRDLREGEGPLHPMLAIRALLAVAKSEQEARSMDTHNAIEIIKALQIDPGVDPDDLFKVEWAYVSLLDEHSGASPVLLERRLASEPSFFCEVIRLIYRSRGTPPSEEEPSAEVQAIASNAWRLLWEWRTPPGSQEDGTFSGEVFNEWLNAMREEAANSGHLEVALITVGQVLIHSPADPDGLWIHRSVADALNDQDAADMRRGFHTETINSRGAHWVDPSGSPERELAEKFRKQAEEIENAGYARFAATIQNLADNYDREADRIIEEHARETEEEA